MDVTSTEPHQVHITFLTWLNESNFGKECVGPMLLFRVKFRFYDFHLKKRLMSKTATLRYLTASYAANLQSTKERSRPGWRESPRKLHLDECVCV